jgi:hypothetical protein
MTVINILIPLDVDFAFVGFLGNSTEKEIYSFYEVDFDRKIIQKEKDDQPLYEFMN